uniref:Auxin-responsive protein n=1 Tax=Ananas comosus var. bracteatus TaxID=296719 RepID=A0A6V7PMK4_ANACO|nr:unnamed protein product [Ananas comosus var. bracteatus]
MHPRLDSSMLGLQSDMYQTIAAAALQEIRDPSKQLSPNMLQFQQPQNMTSRSTLLPSQIIQQGQPQLQQPFLQTIPENKIQSHVQSNYLQQCQPISDQRQQIQQVEQKQLHQQAQQQKHLSDHQQVPNVVSALSNLTSSPQSQMQAISFSQPQNYSDANNNSLSAPTATTLHNILMPFSQEAPSNLLNMPRSTPMAVSNPWSSKRVAVESVLSSIPQCFMPQMEQQLEATQPNMSQHSATQLAPFPGRECSVDQDGSTDTQNNLLFGVNIDPSSLLMQSSMLGLRSVDNGNDANSMPYSACNYLGSTGNDFPLNQALTSSNCLDESGFLQSTGNVDQVNPQRGTFVKVSKPGTFGRSLDITKFSSYNELRSELGRLFGLEGQLEDPLRSGWQLVFVDRENDVLLVGDDPWQEFVNSVSCIKILSPQEVQQMGKQDTDLLNSAHIKRLPGNNCEGYVSRPDTRSLSNGMTPVGSLEY